MTDEQIDDLWIHRPSIHDGQLMPQLRDFARAILARQPTAIGKEAVTPVRIADAERAAYKVSGHRAGEKWTKAFAEALLAAPLPNEASKPAPSVEQDERGAFEQYLRDKKFPVLPVWKDGRPYRSYTLEKMWDTWIKARAASTSANGDRFDPYRLKVAEECCERLMSACTDAGCPDGVRMDDWIRENIRSTSANVAQGAEAVATVKVYETYTGQNGWIEVTQEEYDRTKDKCEHRILRVPAPPAQTGNKRD